MPCRAIGRRKRMKSESRHSLLLERRQKSANCPMPNMTVTLQEGHGCVCNRGPSPCPPLCFIVHHQRTRSCRHLCSPSWVSLLETIQLLAPNEGKCPICLNMARSIQTDCGKCQQGIQGRCALMKRARVSSTSGEKIRTFSMIPDDG